MRLRSPLIAVVALAIGLTVGHRYHPMTVTKTTEHVVTRVETRVVAQTHTIYVHDLAKNVVTDTVTTKQPDGTQTTETKTVDLSKTEVSDLSINNSIADSKTDVNQVTTVTKTAPVPSWSLTLSPGLSYTPSTNYLTSLPLNSHLMLGLEVDHRFIGPLSLGVWANTHLEAGIALRID